MKKKSTKKRVVTPPPPMADRIRSLREQRGETQTVFAAHIGVSRSMLADWEHDRGDGPTSQRLLTIGNLATKSEDRLWFWKEAGLDITLVQGDLRQAAELRVNSARLGLTAKLPVFQGIPVAVDDSSGLTATSDWHLYISEECIKRPGAALGVVIDRRSRLLGAATLPSPLSVGDLVIIDRTQISPRDFLDDPSKTRKIAVLLLPGLPSHSRGGALLREEDAERDAAMPEWAAPVLLFGRISEQPSSDPEFDLGDGLSRAWRLVFQVGASPLFVPLTDWVKGELPRDLILDFLNGARIFGAVTGWIQRTDRLQLATSSGSGELDHE